jgi:hypothetical protein
LVASAEPERLAIWASARLIWKAILSSTMIGDFLPGLDRRLPSLDHELDDNAADAGPGEHRVTRLDACRRRLSIRSRFRSADFR